MRKSLLLAVVLASGCTAAEVRYTGPLPIARPCWTSAPLPAEAADDVAVYTLPDFLADAPGIETFVKTALPPNAWREPARILRSGASLFVTTRPAAQERVARLVKALARTPARRCRTTVRVFEAGPEVGPLFGPLQTTSSSRGTLSFLRAPLSREASAELERLAREGKVVRVATDTELEARPGDWVMRRPFLRQRAYVESVEPGSRPGTFDPCVGILNLGLEVSAGVLPLAESEAMLLAYHVHDCAEVDPVTLPCETFVGWTSVPLELPRVLDSEAEGAVLLAPGESLALVGAAARGARVRIVVLTPSAGES